MASNKSDYNTQYYCTSATKKPPKKIELKSKELKLKQHNDSMVNNIGPDKDKKNLLISYQLIMKMGIKVLMKVGLKK